MDNLDRILSSEEPLTPSSGFAAGVMDGVRATLEKPAPLPFPWVRFLIGIAASVGWALATVALTRQGPFENVAAQLADMAPELGYAAAATGFCLFLVYGRRMRLRA